MPIYYNIFKFKKQVFLSGFSKKINFFINCGQRRLSSLPAIDLISVDVVVATSTSLAAASDFYAVKTTVSSFYVMRTVAYVAFNFIVALHNYDLPTVIMPALKNLIPRLVP